MTLVPVYHTLCMNLKTKLANENKILTKFFRISKYEKNSVTVLCISQLLSYLIYRAFHNVLRDYKKLLQEIRRTRIYETCSDGTNKCATCISCKVRKVPLPRDLTDLMPRIIAPEKNIDAPMLTRVWQELEYRIDVCRVTRGAHIDHLQLLK